MEADQIVHRERRTLWPHLLVADRRAHGPVEQFGLSFGCRLFGQLFHPGREIMESQDGSLPVAYAPSSAPNERFHVMPAPLSQGLIDEIVEGYAAGARRMVRAGMDGVEIIASHGYLPAQFLSPNANTRDDDYGGPFENRVRFMVEVVSAVRAAVSKALTRI